MLKFHKTISSCLSKSNHVCLVALDTFYRKGGYKKILDEALWKNLDPELKKIDAGLTGKSLSTYTSDKKIRTAKFVALPTKISKNNSPTRKGLAFAQLKDLRGKTNASIILVVKDLDQYQALASAIARADSLYDQRSSAEKSKRLLNIIAIDATGEPINPSKLVVSTAENTQLACTLVDTAPSDMNPKSFVQKVKGQLKGLTAVKVKEIQGAKLLEEGLGGIHAVGRAAVEAPRLLILDYKPTKSQATIALGGKGVTYDTGGLSLKISGSMVGMKSDMGGAAAVLGAFLTLVASKPQCRIVAGFGLVENAIGPESYKNDDIINMHSGKTVEINNTDAEGRVVLADVMSYLGRKFKPDLMINAATLTGAQMVATGLQHAGMVSNQVKSEALAIKAGYESGDLVAPLPFAPEFFKSEFASQVADMKNSVKNRMNAQSSCAAQFIYNHIEDLDIPWIHIDLAGPSFSGELATGFGVGLIERIVRNFVS